MSTGGPFWTWRVIEQSFLLWLRNLPLLFALVLVVSLPRIGYNVYQVFAPYDGTAMPDDATFAELLAWLLPFLAAGIFIQVLRRLFMFLSQAVVIVAVYERLRGGTPTFRGSLRGGLRRLVPVVRVSLVLTAIEVVIGIAGSIPLYLLLAHDEQLYGEALPYAIHALQILILVVLMPFWVAVPAAVADRSGSALRRSWELTRAFRVRVLVILIAVYGLDWFCSRKLMTWAADLPLLANSAVWWTKDLLYIAVEAVLAVVGYRALRLEKEGVDAARLEDVFA